MKKINPLLYIVGVGVFALILAIFLVLIGVPGGIVGVVVFFSVIMGTTIVNTQLKKKK